MDLRRVIIGVSGASGAAYAFRILERMGGLDGVESHLVVTAAGKMAIGLESDRSVSDLESLADHVHTIKNVAAPIASGSFRTLGMIVAPCSIRVLSDVATSRGADLLTRAADVTLKERRPLVLMVRETPLHLGHLRNMAAVAEMGGVVFPPVPAFYTKPESIDDLISYTADRALEQLGLELPDALHWEGPGSM